MIIAYNTVYTKHVYVHGIQLQFNSDNTVNAILFYELNLHQNISEQMHMSFIN